MQPHATPDSSHRKIFMAGERVPPGIYKQIDGARELSLDHEDYLPASLDGSVACYARVQHTWEQTQDGHQASMKHPAISSH